MSLLWKNLSYEEKGKFNDRALNINDKIIFNNKEIQCNPKKLKSENNKKKIYSSEEETSSDDESNSLKSCEISTRSKIKQIGIIYKKERKTCPNLISLSAEICSSWGFFSKITSFKKLIDEANETFDVNFTINPLGGRKKEFFVYLENKKLNEKRLIFSNKESNKEKGTIVNNCMDEFIIKQIIENLQKEYKN